jgi:hypothetical protein
MARDWRDRVVIRLLREFVVFCPQQFFGMMERVGAGLAAVEVWWGDPFGVAVVVFAGGPALFGEFVVGAAGQGEIVDVGDRVGGVGVVVMGFAEVGGHAAARE